MAPGVSEELRGRTAVRPWLLDRKLSVEIDVLDHQDIGARFPLSQAGNPTINVRLLLDDE